MKKTKRLMAVIAIILAVNVSAQVTEAEKNLKTLVTDTVSGWRFGGVTAINASQTALVNWACRWRRLICCKRNFQCICQLQKRHYSMG